MILPGLEDMSEEDRVELQILDLQSLLAGKKEAFVVLAGNHSVEHIIAVVYIFFTDTACNKHRVFHIPANPAEELRN